MERASFTLVLRFLYGLNLSYWSFPMIGIALSKKNRTTPLHRKPVIKKIGILLTPSKKKISNRINHVMSYDNQATNGNKKM